MCQIITKKGTYNKKLTIQSGCYYHNFHIQYINNAFFSKSLIKPSSYKAYFTNNDNYR